MQRKKLTPALPGSSNNQHPNPAIDYRLLDEVIPVVSSKPTGFPDPSSVSPKRSQTLRRSALAEVCLGALCIGIGHGPGESVKVQRSDSGNVDICISGLLWRSVWPFSWRRRGFSRVLG